MPERHIEADCLQGRLRPRPDLRSRHSEVLAAERHVIAHSREDHLGVGVLQHEPRTSAGGHGRSAVDDQRALALALFLTPSTPARPCSRVDLPAPDAPSTSTRSPGSMRKEMSRSAQARRLACRHPQPRASTAAGAV